MLYKNLLIAAGGGIIDHVQQADQEECANVFIGLGGTGISCLKEVKKQVYNRLKPDDVEADVKTYKHIQFLAIDADESSLGDDNSLSTLDKVTEFVNLSNSNIHGVLSNPRVLRQEPSLKWLSDKLAIHDAANGLGGVRQAGRLAVMQNCGKIKKEITKKINLARTDLIGKQLNIHIFTGMGGGTGSGAFLDICYIIQHVLGQLSLKGQAETCGYFFLPDVNLDRVRSDTVRQYIEINGFAAMKELDYCMNFAQNGGRWNQTYDGFTVNTTDAPVRLAHLITAKNEDGDIRENGYFYAMNVVVDYVMEFMTKQKVDPNDRAAGNFGLKSHIANFDNIVLNLNKKRGARYYYCVLGASHAYMPYKDINSYFASRIFEAYAKLPKTNHDIAGFITDNGLDYSSLLNAINKDVRPIPIFEVDAKTLMDQVSGLTPDVIPGILTQMRDALPSIEGTLTRNRENQVKSVILFIKNKLVEISKMPEKGPVYASLFLCNPDREARDLTDIVKGYIDENNNNLANFRSDLTLRDNAIAATLRELQNAKLSKNQKAKNYVSAVHAYFNQLAKIALYKEMGDFLTELLPQITDLYEKYFVPVNTMLGNVAETFDQNYVDLCDNVTLDDDYAMKIIGLDDRELKASLDAAVGKVDCEKVVLGFISHMINNSDSWLGQSNDNKICAAVSDYFVSQLKEFTHKNIDFYLQEKFKVDGQQQLASQIYQNIMVNLQRKAKPLFWCDTRDGGIDSRSRIGYCSIPDTSTAIEAACDILAKADPEISKRKSVMPDRISMLIFYCGVPMYKFKGAYNYRSRYDDRTQHGVHLYEGTVDDPRDFSKLHNIVPLSLYHEDELNDKIREFIDDYARAEKLGIISKEAKDPEGVNFEYRIRMIDEEDLGDKLARIEKLKKEASIERMERFIADEDKTRLKFGKSIVLPNTGVDEFKDSVVKDHVYASQYYRDILSEQLEKAAGFEESKAEITKMIADSEAGGRNLALFCNCLCTGIIKLENKFTLKYSKDDDGLIDWYELTGVDTAPYGDSLPLYSAYIEFCKLDDEDKAEFEKVAKDRILSDEDACLDALKVFKEYLAKRADVMKEIADDSFRKERKDIYKFVDTLVRSIRSFERKLL